MAFYPSLTPCTPYALYGSGDHITMAPLDHTVGEGRTDPMNPMSPWLAHRRALGRGEGMRVVGDSCVRVGAGWDLGVREQRKEGSRQCKWQNIWRESQ